MTNVIIDLWNNPYLRRPFTAWVVAQLLKVITTYIRESKIDFERLVGAGGMPSAHSAVVSCMTVTIARFYGWDSMPTAFSLIVSLIIMYDAAGVRRAAGKQARVLNRIVEEFAHTHRLREERLIELLGHTPVEVFAGAILGIFIGYL